ncbi:hypothetical protein [Streptomyces dioscori]|nr:hypothetical protein [Streptomyces dioscori]
MHLTHSLNFLAYKGLETVPTWSIVVGVVLAAVGIVLGTLNRHK